MNELDWKELIRKTAKKAGVLPDDVHLKYSIEDRFGCVIKIQRDKKSHPVFVSGVAGKDGYFDDAAVDAISSVDIYRQIWKEDSDKKLERSRAKRKGVKYEPPFKL